MTTKQSTNMSGVSPLEYLAQKYRRRVRQCLLTLHWKIVPVVAMSTLAAVYLMWTGSEGLIDVRIDVNDASPRQLQNLVRSTGVTTPSNNNNNNNNNNDNDTLTLSECRLVSVNTCRSLTIPERSQVRRRHRFWQVHEDGDIDIAVYSAFYDDRPLVGSSPVVRVSGVAKDTLRDGLYCHLWYQQQTHPVVVDARILLVGAGHVVQDNVRYEQYLFTCNLPIKHLVPAHVSLVTRKCSPSTILLPVQSPVRSDSNRWQHEFSVCVETSFGSVAVEKIVEWIETNRMFGISLFNIYNGNITDPSTLKILKYYAKRRIVRLRRLPPAVHDDTLEGVKLSSPTSFNDCLMRNMYSSRFMVTLDYDEIIVPRMDSNYSALLDRIDGALGVTESYHTYSFRNVYFFTYFQSDESQPRFLRTMRFRRRAPPDDYLFATKSFVDPRRCLALFNHYCLVRLPGADNERFEVAVDVDSSLALSHHYRFECPPELGHEQCQRYHDSQLQDDIMLKYRQHLEYEIRRVLETNGFHV